MLPHLQRLDELGHVDVEQSGARIGEPVRIEWARTQVLKLVLDSVMAASGRLIGSNTLTAARLTGGK